MLPLLTNCPTSITFSITWGLNLGDEGGSLFGASLTASFMNNSRLECSFGNTSIYQTFVPSSSHSSFVFFGAITSNSIVITKPCF
jgi:hypothetical protein